MYPLVLSFSGKIGSGKDYIIDNYVVPYIRSKNRVVHTISFADYLKILCIVKDKIHYNRLFVEKDIVSRNALFTRSKIEQLDNNSIFTEIVDNLLKLEYSRGTDIVVIRDVRYMSEIDFINSINGIIIRLSSSKRTRDKILSECNGDIEKMSIIASHSSETNLDDYRGYNYTISNDYENSSMVREQVQCIIDEVLK